jgi:ribosomal protein S27AE
VDFKSAQSTHAVCGFCQSSIVRQGDVLSRIGKMAELFDDHSPLQLQATGTWRGQGFTLVGRLQYKYPEGTWTEWHALLADGTSAYLSEDNGRYVLAIPKLAPGALPAAERFQVGATSTISGEAFSVASNQQVLLLAAQGELPRLPELGQPFAMVELRSQQADTVLSIDYSTQPPTVTLGQPVLLDDLKLTDLRDASVKDEKGRQFNCPNCGAPVMVALASSQSVGCGACGSLIDVSQGIGGELQHALQDEPVQPLIALGSVGQLQGVLWQVVGFQHRMGVDPGDPDEHFGWEEYLLYNQKRGFIFLVDATDGWSLVRPVTGAPVLSKEGASASYLSESYSLKESYQAETTYALGEFYWQVQRGQRTSNSDFAKGSSMLSMEKSPAEVVWSVGSRIDSVTVAKAFALEGKSALFKRSDVGPLSASGVSRNGIVLAVFLVLLVLLIVSDMRCSSCDPAQENCSSNSSRSSGGSFGGFSSGGGHK